VAPLGYFFGRSRCRLPAAIASWRSVGGQ
jgi:hypothetical protein